MSFLCSSACSRAAWSFRGNSDASSSIYRQLKVLQLLQMNNNGVETMLCNLLRAWLSNFWNKKCFDLPTRPDTVRFFLVCLLLSLTHDSPCLLTLVSYCCVTHIIETFCCDRCYTTITCCHRKPGYPGMISAVPLSFFLYFFTVVLLSAFLSVFLFAWEGVFYVSLSVTSCVILLLFFFLMWLYFYFLPLFFSHPHCCQM